MTSRSIESRNISSRGMVSSTLASARRRWLDGGKPDRAITASAFRRTTGISLVVAL